MPPDEPPADPPREPPSEPPTPPPFIPPHEPPPNPPSPPRPVTPPSPARPPDWPWDEMVPIYLVSDATIAGRARGYDGWQAFQNKWPGSRGSWEFEVSNLEFEIPRCYRYMDARDLEYLQRWWDATSHPSARSMFGYTVGTHPCEDFSREKCPIRWIAHVNDQKDGDEPGAETGAYVTCKTSGLYCRCLGPGPPACLPPPLILTHVLPHSPA